MTAGFGGALDNAGVMTVAGSALSSNTAQNDGGAIYNHGTMSVSDSTLNGNTIQNGGYNGGAIYNDQDGTMTVSTSTLATNSAVVNGGAIYNLVAMTLSAVTVSGNSALYGGGVITQSLVDSAPSSADTGPQTSLTLVDAIVAGNTLSSSSGKDPDVESNVTAGSTDNLIGNGTGLSGITNGINGNKIGYVTAPINPLLAPLGTYGGTLQTMPPQAGSPALASGGSITTLTAAIGSADTLIPVADAAAVANSVSSQFQPIIQIDGEVMYVTNIDLANNTLTVSRLGPVKANHADGAGVYFDTDETGDVIQPSSLAMGAEQPQAVAPTVTQISPASGPAAGGTSVTITGTGFTGATEVTFGNTAATSFNVVSATEITATSPAGTGTVDVEVTAPGGTSSTSTADQFTYQVVVAAIVVAAPSTATAGTPFNVTVTAEDSSGKTVTGYNGPATLTSSDGQTVTPATVQLTNGTVTVPVTLDKANTVTLAAAIGTITGTSGQVAVGPGAPASILVKLLSGSVTAATTQLQASGSDQPPDVECGKAHVFDFTVVDAFDNACPSVLRSASLAPAVRRSSGLGCRRSPGASNPSKALPRPSSL